jgi:hypothetical protein
MGEQPKGRATTQQPKVEQLAQQKKHPATKSQVKIY